MTLDPTAREANVRDSLKKFFVDNLNKTEGIPIVFDRFLESPKLQGKEVDRWVGVDLADATIDSLSEQDLDVYVCTRKDPENFRLSQLRDTVMNYLTPSSDDVCFKTIPFYRSYATSAWTSIGGFVITRITQTRDMVAEDQTKFKIIYVQMKYASKI
jgi:hypothetical protein